MSSLGSMLQLAFRFIQHRGDIEKVWPRVQQTTAHVQQLWARVQSAMPRWMAQMQLDECFRCGVCPDCASQTLDKKTMICRQCGSRFLRDAAGKWSRLP